MFDSEFNRIFKALKKTGKGHLAMNDQIKELAEKAGLDILTDNILEKFAELIIRECTDRCGSQADQRNILRSFGLEVESNIKYPSPERDGSVNSQYEREYNLPKG
jgi:hypothetical protein